MRAVGYALSILLALVLIALVFWLCVVAGVVLHEFLVVAVDWAARATGNREVGTAIVGVSIFATVGIVFLVFALGDT